MFAFINGQHLLNGQLSSHNTGIYRASYGISAVCVGKLLRQHLYSVLRGQLSGKRRKYTAISIRARHKIGGYERIGGVPRTCQHWA